MALLAPGSSPTPAGAPVPAPVPASAATLSGATLSGATLSGRLDLVEHAAVADLVLVASTDGGLHLVDPRAAGVTITAHDTLDRTSRLSTITLDGAPSERLAGSSPEVLQQLLDRAAVLVAGDLVGLSRKALTDTVEYDKTRVQFGKPVGSFQAVKHELADLHLAVTMAEYAATYAAHAADAGLVDAQLAASIAKAKASDVAGDFVGAMIQFHGGIGYTWEHDAHIYFKRAKRLQYAYGDAVQHRERIARLALDPLAVQVAEPAGAA